MRLERQLWWGIHGPREFVRALVGALQEGRSVVLLQPAHAPPELDAVVREWILEHTHLRYIGVEVGAGEDVTQRLYKEIGQVTPTTLPKVLHRKDLRQAIIHFTHFGDMASESTGLHIKRLIEQTRNLPGDKRRRPRFVFSIRDPANCAKLKDSIGRGGPLTIMGWRNVLRDVDMGAYVSTLMHERKGPGPWRLYEAVVRHLSVFDRVLADRLSTLSSNELLDVERTIQKMAASEPKIAWNWQRGGMDLMDDRKIVHPIAALQKALDTNTPQYQRDQLKKSVRDLIWRAHLAEIFPWLEQVRYRVLDGLYRTTLEERIRRGTLMNRRGRAIEDLESIEYTDLVNIIEDDLGGRRDADHFVYAARAARNHLAHRRPVPAAKIQELLRAWEEAPLA